MANKPGFWQKAWNTVTTIPTGAYNLGRKAYQLGQSVGKPSAPARKPAGPPIAPARKPATPPAQKSPYSQKG